MGFWGWGPVVLGLRVFWGWRSLYKHRYLTLGIKMVCYTLLPGRW